MKPSNRRTALQWIAASAAASATPWAGAQADWPNKPMKIVVPVAAAGIIDLLARNLAEALRPRLPAGIVVENRPGGDQTIGTQIVARSPGDGTTFLCGATPFTTTAHLRKAAGFDPFKDFKPVSLLATSPNVVVVPPSLGVNSMQELIALAKRKPGGLTYANPGNGSSNHLGTEQLRAATGAELLSVVYPGQPPAITDLLTGRVDFMLMSSALAPAHIEAGKLKALAVIAPGRMPRFANVPTIAEAGFATVNVVPWIGVLAPAATPDSIVERMHSLIEEASQTAGYKEGVVRIGATQAASHRIADFAAMLRAEYDQWPELFKRAGLEKS